MRDLGVKYDRAKSEEEALIQKRDQLRAIQNERSGVSEWTVGERAFVASIARKLSYCPINF